MFYRVINETMRGLIIATWGAWDETRVRREAAEFAKSANGQVIEVADLRRAFWSWTGSQARFGCDKSTFCRRINGKVSAHFS